MKSILKLTLFFSFNFALLFAAIVALGLLSSWVDFARYIPIEARAGQSLEHFAWNALPAALYLTMLLGLGYTARRTMPAFLAVVCIFILGSVFFLGASLGISRAGDVEILFRPVAQQGEPGLILSRGDNAIILLRETGDIWGPRVVSIPGQPLLYQDVPRGPNNTVISLPPLPFDDSAPWFIRNLVMDFSLNAAELRGRMEMGLLYFGAYALALILLLSSIRFLFGLGRWPLASLCIAALAFRGIAALESFLNTGEINELLNSLLPGLLPPLLITPAIFAALAVLTTFYALLIHATRPRRNKDE
ncbi:MAG: hypothetical protein FWC64_13345 [Treponema sp.]|nr:hypothetical protein [Treponema sp.]